MSTWRYGVIIDVINHRKSVKELFRGRRFIHIDWNKNFCNIWDLESNKTITFSKEKL